MTSGIQIFGDKNTVQIDSNYSNLAFRQKISLVYSQFSFVSGLGVPIHYFNVSNSSEIPMICVAPTGRICTVWSIQPLGNSTWRVGIATEYVNSLAGGTAIGDVYVYAKPLPVDLNASGYGLQVFDNQGNVTFDSNQLPMSVVGYLYARDQFYMVNGVAQNTATYTIPNATGRKFAFCTSGASFYRQGLAQTADPSGGYSYFVDMIQISLGLDLPTGSMSGTNYVVRMTGMETYFDEGYGVTFSNGGADNMYWDSRLQLNFGGMVEDASNFGYADVMDSSGGIGIIIVDVTYAGIA